jgi:hypothetical protein
VQTDPAQHPAILDHRRRRAATAQAFRGADADVLVAALMAAAAPQQSEQPAGARTAAGLPVADDEHVPARCDAFPRAVDEQRSRRAVSPFAYWRAGWQSSPPGVRMERGS